MHDGDHLPLLHLQPISHESKLKNLGVKIFKGHKENNVLKKDLVVISSAISKKKC